MMTVNSSETATPSIAVVIPSYRASRSVLGVIALIGPQVARIYVVDDACPEQTGRIVEKECRDPRVHVIRHETNQGVGGATITGTRAAIADGMDIIVKIDSDGQMDPELIPYFVQPILKGHADYTKGNRFFDVESFKSMPQRRIFGNAVLSIMAKFSTGYWNIFDPTNGYTAIHSGVASILPLHKINKRYFFETDMLYYLNLCRAVVMDIPMRAHYGEEVSNLRIGRIIGSFLGLHITRFFRRILANYFLRDFSFASLCLMTGVAMLLFGIIYGGPNWFRGVVTGIPTPVGTVVLVALCVIVGVQLLLAFFAADTASVPRNAIHPLLSSRIMMPLKQFTKNSPGEAANAPEKNVANF